MKQIDFVDSNDLSPVFFLVGDRVPANANVGFKLKQNVVGVHTLGHCDCQVLFQSIHLGLRFLLLSVQLLVLLHESCKCRAFGKVPLIES